MKFFLICLMDSENDGVEFILVGKIDTNFGEALTCDLFVRLI